MELFNFRLSALSNFLDLKVNKVSPFNSIEPSFCAKTKKLCKVEDLICVCTCTAPLDSAF